MVTSRKLAHLAGAAALTVLLGATAPIAATAVTGDQAYASTHRDGKKASKARSAKKHVVKKHVVKKRVVVRKRVVVHKHVRPRNRIVVRTTAYVPPLVVLGPRVVYRSYGSGWCRALHRGRHWAPRIGWHSGRHVGRVRC